MLVVGISNRLRAMDEWIHRNVALINPVFAFRKMELLTDMFDGIEILVKRNVMAKCRAIEEPVNRRVVVKFVTIVRKAISTEDGNHNNSDDSPDI